MPAVDAVIVAAIIAAFVIFAAVLTWAEHRTRNLSTGSIRGEIGGQCAAARMNRRRVPRRPVATKRLLVVPVMRGLLVMQAQKIDAVIVAVRRAHDGVHVEFRRLGIGEKDTGVVIELDEDHRALNPVVERARFIEAADPAKMRVAEMPLDFIEAGGKRPRRQRRHIGGNQIDEIAPLLRRQC